MLCCCCGWVSAQTFPYDISVETVSGHCYDDGHLIFTILDGSGNAVQIDPQTHNAVNTAQYPLYNVQYHYQNVASGLGVQYDYSNDIMLTAGTYNVGVRVNIPAQSGGYVLVDTTIYNVQISTSYDHLEASVLSNLALGNADGMERYGYRPAFDCADIGRIQLQITNGAFPYEVSILDEQQVMIRHAVFQHRVNNGNYYQYANYRDYYTFDSLAAGSYSILVSDSCGYTVTLSFIVPNAEPTRYLALVTSENSYHPEETVIPFVIERRYGTGYGGFPWYNYSAPYIDSIIPYRFINPGSDTTEWRTIVSPVSYVSTIGTWSYIYDTISNYCVIFNDTVRMQIHDLCHDTLMTFTFYFLPQFGLHDTMEIVHLGDSIIHDTCATYLQNGFSTQIYRIEGDTWTDAGKTIYGGSYYVSWIPFRYHRYPLSYDVWSLPDSTLLGHSESNEFTGLGTWVSFPVDTSVSVHISITDSLGCQLAEKDTVLVYHSTPVDSLLFWFETHNDIDDDGWEHCCDQRYLWIQEHGVDANTFRRNMTLHLFESPLYNSLNFTAVRQEGVWTVTFEDTNNHSTYVEFSYEDGWRATIQDSECLPPGRYKFEVITDCGTDTITKEWAGYYYDSLSFASSPQYEMHQVCDQMVVTQVSTGLENYVYYIDPSISNDSIIQENCDHSLSLSSSGSISSTTDPLTGNKVLTFSVPGTYYLTTTSYNYPPSYFYQYHDIMWCHPNGTSFVDAYDTITVTFSYLDFDLAAALLCDSTSVTGMVTAQAVNGNAPYTYTLYDQWNATGTVIATNSTGFFDNVPMTEGQHFSVQVTDSCMNSFSVNVSASVLTSGNLLWEQGANAGALHCAGDTVHLTAFTFLDPATYQWTGPNGFNSTSQTNDIVLPYNGEEGWYTVEILNSFCGPVISDSIYIPVVPSPQVSIIGDTIVCPGTEVTLSFVPQGYGQVSFDVFHPGGQNAFTVNADDTLSYSYPVQPGSVFWVDHIVDERCSSLAPVDSFHVGIYALSPEPTDFYDTICQGSGYNGNGFTLTVEETDTAGSLIRSRLRTTGPGGCIDTVTLHLWVISVDTFFFAQSVCENFTWNGVTYNTSGSYTQSFSVTDVCDSIVTLLLTVEGPPVVTVSVEEDTICQGAGTTLSAEVGNVDWLGPESPNAIEYLWSNGSTDPDIYVTLEESTLFTVTVTVNGECSETAEALVTVRDMVHESGTVYLCENDSVTITADHSPPFLWSTGDTTQSITVSEAGDYIVSLLNVFGCNYDSTIHVIPVSISINHLSADFCDFFEWDDSIYTESSVCRDTIPGSYGCDSIFEIQFTIHHNPIVDVFLDDMAAGDTQTVVFGPSESYNLHYSSSQFSLNYGETDFSGPWVDSIQETLFTISPPDSLLHDTTVVYTFTLTNELDCSYDTSISIHVYAHQYIDIYDTVTSSDLPYTWNGAEFLHTGIQTVTIPTVHGADSVITMHLSVIYAYDTTVCDNFLPVSWRNQVFTEADTLTLSFVANGTDSIEVLSFQVNEVTYQTVNAVVLENNLPYELNGQSYDSTGTYSQILENVAGCDSVLTINLLVVNNLTVQIDSSVCSNELPVVWNDSVFTQAGTIVTVQTSFLGADSVIVMNLTVRDTTDTTLYVTVLENDLPYTLNGSSYQEEGSYTQTLTNAVDCDSVLTLELTVLYNISVSIDSIVCANELPFIWNDSVFSAEGTKTTVIPASSGVDSIISMTLHTRPIPSAQISGSSILCPDSSGTISVDSAMTYLWSCGDTTQSITVNACGHYSVTVTDEFGCVNTATHKVMHVIVNPVETIQIPAVCAGSSDTVVVGRSQECQILIGQYDTIPPLSDAVMQSDDILTAGTEVSLVEVEGPWMESVGDTIFVVSVPAGLPHDTIVTGVIHLYNAFGCGYDTTVSIVCHSRSQSEFDTTVCDVFLWNGVTYTATGQYTQTLDNVNGCDSVITVNLTVFYSTVLNDTLELVQNQLPYYFAPTDTTFGVNSASSISFSYWRANEQGCDTLCNQTVIIYQNTQHAEDTTVCASALPFTWHGHTFTDEGSHTDTLFTVHGSDSVCVYTLMVDLLSAEVGSPTHIVCYGASTGAASAVVSNGTVPLTYQWTDASGATVSTTVQISNQPAGFYTFNVTDQLGCTATDTVTLQTLNGELLPGSISDNQEVCEGDMLAAFTGTAASGGDNSVYQWQFSTDNTDWVTAPGVGNGQDYSYPNAASTGFSLRRAWISQSCGTVYSNTVTVAVGVNSIDTVTAQVCQNTPYTGFGFDITADETADPGVFSFEMHYAVGTCDSIVVLVLTVNAPSSTELTVQECGSYTWNGVTYYESGSYEQTLVNAAGCDSLVQLQLTLIDTVVEIVPLTENFCEEMSAELSVVTELTDYLWSTGEEMPNITVTVPGTYRVTASQGDCRNSASYTISPCELQVFLPNAITPSRSDGQNDWFALPAATQAIMHSFEISVFNRWGEQVYYSTDKNFRWNGEVKGKISYNTVYTYVIRYTDANGKPYYVRGSITVL